MIQIKKTPRKEAASGLMSADELKARLQQHFAKSGTLNNLKTQLRNQLVTELFKVAELPTSKIEYEFSDNEAKKTLLPLQVSNWLVYDHLKRQGYDYSLSTFVAEASVSFPEKLLTLKDVLDLLGLRSESEESEIITKHYFHCKEGSFLHSLLSCVMKQHSKQHLPDLKCNKSTIPKGKFVPSSAANNSTQPPQHFLDDSQTRQQDLLLQLRLLNESPNNDLDIHQRKFYQEMQSEKEEHEKEVQKLRQKLLNELDRLYEHEQQVRLELEQRKSRLTREQDLLDLERSKLRTKELELAKRSSLLETETEKMYFIKEESFSLVLKEKEEELSKLEEKLKQQEQKLSEERLMLSNQKIEMEDLRNQLHQMENNYRSIQEKYTSLLDENTFLKSKVENVADSVHLNAELLNTLKEVENFKMQIKEIKEKAEVEKHVLLNTVQSLQEQLKMCFQKAADVKDISVATESAHCPDESVWNQQRDRLEQELGETKHLYHEVLQKLEKQNEDIQDLHLTVHVLYGELSDATNQARLAAKAEDKKIDSPPPGVSSPVERPRQVKRTSSPHAHQSLNHFSHSAQYPGLYYPLPTVQRTYSDDPCKFISDAKKRISDLEQEAQVVKKKYSTFVATQVNLSHQGYAPFGSAFHNYDLVNTPYTIPSYDIPFSGDPYFGVSYPKNTGEETVSNHSFPNSNDMRLSGNYASRTTAALPFEHHAQFLNDAQLLTRKIDSFGARVVGPSDTVVLSQCSQVQKPNTCQSNGKSDSKSHTQIVSSHKYPISSDSLLVAPVPPVSSDSITNINSTASCSSVPSKYVSSNYPFHLSKFGLHSIVDKAMLSPLVITDNPGLPHSLNSKEQNESHAQGDESSGESSSQRYPKISDTGVLSDKHSHLNCGSSIKEKSLHGSCTKSEYCSGEVKAGLCTASQNLQSDFKHPAPISKEQIRTSISDQSPKHSKQSQNSTMGKQDESEKDNTLTQSFDEVSGYQTVSLKSNKSVDFKANVKILDDQPTSLAPNQNLETSKDDTSEKITGTKPKSGVLFRRISVDLDSAWKQQTASLSPTAKNFLRPRAGSSHSLPSKFDHVEAIAAAQLKTKVESDLKCDDISCKDISSPRSHSFTEDHLMSDHAKSKNDSVDNDRDAIVKANDDVKMHQVSENLGSSHESVSSNDPDIVAVEKHNGAVDLDSLCHEKRSVSCEAVEKQSDLDVDLQSVKPTSIECGECNVKQSQTESDHDISENVKSLKSLAHAAEQVEEVSNFPSSADDIANVGSAAKMEADVSLHVDFVDNDLLQTKNTKSGTAAEMLSAVASLDETDRLQTGYKKSESENGSTRVPICEEKPVGESSNNYVVGALDESISELSELNFSAGNEELELSKGEESDW